MAQPRRFGEYAVSLGFVRAEQVEAALEFQRQRGRDGESAPLIGELFVELGWMTRAEVGRVLKTMTGRAGGPAGAG